MKKMIGGALTALLIVTSNASFARAETVIRVSGHVCVPGNSAASENLSYVTQWGPFNSNVGSAPSEVSCSVPTTTSKVTIASVFYFNRNPTIPVRCTLKVTDFFGNASFSEEKVSPSAAPDIQGFSWNIPANNSAGIVTFQCVIPPKVNTGGQNSHITSITVSTV